MVHATVQQSCSRRRQRAPVIGRTSENDNTDTLSQYKSIRICVKRTAPTGGGKALSPRQEDLHWRCQIELHTDHNGKVTLPGSQCTAGLVHGNQGRGTRCVHCRYGTVKSELKSNSACGKTKPVSSARVRSDILTRTCQLLHAVVILSNPHKDTGSRATQPIGTQTAVLESVPNELKGEPLLRIHQLGLQRGDAKKRRVKLVHPVNKSTVTGVDLS